jgi:murein DD-endopeptidase MepM/ murein hydrolase activator NlpD
MPAVRVRAVFLFLLLALVLTTTGCRGTSSGRSGHGRSGGGLHLPWFSSSHERDPQQSLWTDMPGFTQEFVGSPPLTDEGWVPPLAASPLRVTRPFQPPPTPYAAGHRGVDLAGSVGQEVRAASNGYVAWAGVLAGRGVVVVEHRELRTTYEPVAGDVTMGTEVHPGDRIGSLQRGHPGCPVAACLHWGALRDADYIDPLSLLGHAVRLLPLGRHN